MTEDTFYPGSKYKGIELFTGLKFPFTDRKPVQKTQGSQPLVVSGQIKKYTLQMLWVLLCKLCESSLYIQVG
jgi:hypothetical protein